MCIGPTHIFAPERLQLSCFHARLHVFVVTLQEVFAQVFLAVARPAASVERTVSCGQGFTILPTLPHIIGLPWVCNVEGQRRACPKLHRQFLHSL